MNNVNIENINVEVILIGLSIACIVLLIASAAAFFGLWRARKQLARLGSALDELAKDYDRAGSEVGAFMSDIAGSRVVIEVLEPMSLARSESRFAGPVSGVAPNLILQRVYATVASEVRTELKDRGVKARVRVMHASKEVDHDAD